MTSSCCTRQIITFYEKEMFAHTAFFFFWRAMFINYATERN